MKYLCSDTMTEQSQLYKKMLPQRGPSACLVQEDKSIAFASKSLVGTKTRYANIKRELLTFFFACQLFNICVLRRHFTVESAYKSLEIMIHQKSLASAPLRL